MTPCYTRGLLAALFLLPLAAGCGSERLGTTATEALRTPGPATEADPTGRANTAMRAVLNKHAQLGPRPIETLTPEEARRQPTPADAVRALLEERGESTSPEPVANVQDRTIPGAAGPIPVRIYRPEGDGPHPVVVYFHGGGWVIAGIDVYDASARALTNAAGAMVMAVGYRKGPEHRFPAAHEDAYAAYKWAVENVASMGGDPERIAVAGESAGGNLAANVALRARDEAARQPVHQLLVYPVAGNDLETRSMRENQNAKPLNRAMIPWFLSHYLVRPDQSSDPRINLVGRDDFRNLPPATVITAEIDPLRSEGEALARLLERAGVNTEHHHYDGVAHEFFGMGAAVPDAQRAVQRAGARLRASFRR